MSKLQSDPRLPVSDDVKSLKTRLYEVFRDISLAHNNSFMWDAQLSSVPTTGYWTQGNMVKNTAPSELGTASSKYVIIGWVCTVTGEPGTWLPMRTLTGN